MTVPMSLEDHLEFDAGVWKETAKRLESEGMSAPAMIVRARFDVPHAAVADFQRTMEAAGFP